MNKPIIIDGCNTLKARKLLIRTDNYNIGEDGQIDGTIPFTDICYDLALQLQRLEAENEKLRAENERLKAPSMIIPQVGKLGVPIEQYCKLKQALEEIKEIANEPCLDDEDCETCDENCMSKEIIDKINEVLEDE